MRRRPLPTPEEALAILRAKRTRPQIRPPPPAGKNLAPLLRDLEARFGQGPAALQTRWREIVGDTLARRTEPVRIIKGRNGEGGALELRVDGPVASLIQHQAPQIIQRAELLLGAGAVAKLRIVQGPVRAPVAAKAARKRPPLDAGLEARLARETPDGPLKASLVKLGREVLRGR